MARELRQIFKETVQTVQTGLTNVQTAVMQQYTAAAFYSTNLEQMGQMKCGWLRIKQGGVVRNSWHRRWFILKDARLYYYTSEDDCSNGRPPAGSLYLPGNHVCEVPYNPSADAEKFVFEIQPGDGLRPTSHETHLFMAENDDERRDWLRAIRQILYQKLGGAIFGQSLDITLQYEPKQDKFRKVPELVQSCVEFLKQRGLDEEGIFRLPGRNILIRRLSDLFDRAMRPSLTDVQLTDDGPVHVDVHSVASLLKSYLRELPEPLVPFKAYESVIHIVTRDREISGEEEAINKLSKLLTDCQVMPPSSYNTLQYICGFLAEVARHSDVNKMNTVNLATVFVQSFIRPDLDDPGLMLATSTQRTLATQILISCWDKIFTAEYTADGSSIILGDLLGLDSQSCSSDVCGTVSRAENAGNDGIAAELAGIEFGCPAPLRPPVVFRPDVVRRQSAARSNNSSYRTGMIEDDKNCPQPDEKAANAKCEGGHRRDSDATNQLRPEVSPPEVNGTSTKSRPTATLRNSLSFSGTPGKDLTAFNNTTSVNSVGVGPVPVPPPKPSRMKAAAAKLQASSVGSNPAVTQDAAAAVSECATKSSPSVVALGRPGPADSSPVTVGQRTKKLGGRRSYSLTSAGACDGMDDSEKYCDGAARVDSFRAFEIVDVPDVSDAAAAVVEPGSSCIPVVDVDVSALLRQVEQLTARLQTAERERDEAHVRVRELEETLKLRRGSSGS